VVRHPAASVIPPSNGLKQNASTSFVEDHPLETSKYPAAAAVTGGGAFTGMSAASAGLTASTANPIPAKKCLFMASLQCEMSAAQELQLRLLATAPTHGPLKR
jgi:hypothetical protein